MAGLCSPCCESAMMGRRWQIRGSRLADAVFGWRGPPFACQVGSMLPCATVSNVLDRIPLTRAGVIPVGIRRVSSDSGSFPSWVRLKRAFRSFAAGKRVCVDRKALPITLYGRHCNDQALCAATRVEIGRTMAARLELGLGFREQRGGLGLSSWCWQIDCQLETPECRSAVRKKCQVWYRLDLASRLPFSTRDQVCALGIVRG